MKVIFSSILISLFFFNVHAFKISKTHQKQLAEILKLESIPGKERETIVKARALVSEITWEHPLYQQVDAVLGRLDKETYDESKALKFALGKKSEFYCKNQGLVEVQGTHEDGSSSRVIYVGGKRSLSKGSYTDVKKGQWTWELSNTYRPAVQSTITFSSQKDGFKATEIRKLSSGSVDSRHWRLMKIKNKNDFRTVGNSDLVEPSSMNLGLDFQFWGNVDLGQHLKFQPGFKETKVSMAIGVEEKDLLVQREVVKHFDHYEYKDSMGKSFNFPDCYQVDYVISLKN